jgi:hypothetical protein
MRPTLAEGDAAILVEELRRKIRGEARFDSGSRALYAADASNYRAVPIGVIPRDLEAVIETIAIARRHGAAVLSRGDGTSLAGQCCNVAIVIVCRNIRATSPPSMRRNGSPRPVRASCWMNCAHTQPHTVSPLGLTRRPIIGARLAA